jgi:heme-degrading monooxygenase HmoA
MIARIWRGATRADDADAYSAYLDRTGHAEYRAVPGHRRTLTLRRLDGARAEFVVITLWDSLDAIRRFAGADVERAVFYPEDERFLVDREDRVTHFDVEYEESADS